MTQREELYQKFGPMLLEAIATLCLEEFNRLRRLHNMPEITLQEFADALNNRLSKIEPYSWMSQEVP